MSTLKCLITNELEKVFFKKSIYMYILFLFLMILGGALFNSYNKEQKSDDWRIEVTQEINQLNQDIDNEKSKGNKNEAYINYLTEKQEMKIYALENNIVPSVHNNLGFMNVISNLDLILIIIVILLFNDMILSEFKSNTIKELVVNPISKIQIITSKYFAGLITAVILIISVILFSFIIGSVFFGFGPLEQEYIVQLNGDYHIRNILLDVSSKYILIVFEIGVVLSLVLCISMLTNNSSITTIISSLFVLFHGSINEALVKLQINKFSLTQHFNLTKYITALENESSLVLSILVCSIYIILFIYITSFIFKRRIGV